MKRKDGGPDYSRYDIVETEWLTRQLDNARVISYVSQSNLARRLIHCAYEQERWRQHRLRYAVFRCGSRYCLYCAYREAQRNVRTYGPRFRKLAKQGYRFSILTLTIPNPAYITRELYAGMFENYRKLLKRKPLKNGVIGSLAKLETTFNQKSGTYHPHLQPLLAYQKCSPQEEIMKAWCDLTSPYFDYFDRADYPLSNPPYLDTHIRKVNGPGGVEEAIKDAIDYISKPITFPTTDAFLDYFLATNGLRLVRSYGKLRDNEKAATNHYLDIRGSKSTFFTGFDAAEKTSTHGRAEPQAKRAIVQEGGNASNRGAAIDESTVAAVFRRKAEQVKARWAAEDAAAEQRRRANHMPAGIRCERCNELTPPPPPLCEQCRPLVEAEEAARKIRKFDIA